MANECKLESDNPAVQDLLVYAKCQFQQKNIFESELALIQARIQNPWNNLIQKNMQLVTGEKNFDLYKSHLWSLRFPFEFWLFTFFMFLLLASKYKEYKNYFIFVSLLVLSVSVWAFIQEKKYDEWTVLNESSAVYNLPNLNYEMEKLKKGSLIYLQKIEPGFTRILYKDQIAYIPSDKLFSNEVSVSNKLSMKNYFENLILKIKQFFS